jgi:putative phosphoribosyl transferase
MRTPGAPYLNRRDAGVQLAEALDRYRGSSSTILALPRGGVPLGSAVADRLEAPLDILVVRKVGAPGNREYGVGAVAEGGLRYLDRAAIRELGLTPEDLEPEVRHQLEEVVRLARHLRGGRPASSLQGRTVILVDDGMATGATVQCAIQAVRLQRPGRVVVGVGVSSHEAVEALRPLVDEVVCPLVPRRLFAVGEWYREFPQVSDTEVALLLERHWSQHPVGPLTP